MRLPNSLVANEKLRPTAEPVRAMSEWTAEELTELMVGVVAEGTAAAIPEAWMAGKTGTGTAELGPKPGTEGKKIRSRSRSPGSAPSPRRKRRGWRSASC